MHTCWDDDSTTRHSFNWNRRAVKHVMKQLDAEEDALLKKDAKRSKDEPMVEDEDEDEAVKPQ